MDAIRQYSSKGTILGICGGYQMLGNSLSDPSGVEGSFDKIEGMRLLDVDTLFEEEKITTRVKAHSINMRTSNVNTYGYEIHMGKCSYGEKAKPLFEIYNRNGDNTSSFEEQLMKVEMYWVHIFMEYLMVQNLESIS